MVFHILGGEQILQALAQPSLDSLPQGGGQLRGQRR